MEDFEKRNQTVKEAGIKANILAGLMLPLMGMLSNLNVIVVVGVGAFLLIQCIGNVTVSLIASFAEYTHRFGHPLN